MVKGSFSDLINSDKPTFVDFSAEWCGPCRMMAPILNDLKSKVGDKARIIKVDIDKNPQAATAYRIQNVPTFMLFRRGKVLWRRSGLIASEHLKLVLDEHMMH